MEVIASGTHAYSFNWLEVVAIEACWRREGGGRGRRGVVVGGGGGGGFIAVRCVYLQQLA